jgi:DnaJ-class molecular chaperone
MPMAGTREFLETNPPEQGGERVCPTCGGTGGKWYLEDDDGPMEEAICPDCGGSGKGGSDGES